MLAKRLSLLALALTLACTTTPSEIVVPESGTIVEAPGRPTVRGGDAQGPLQVVWGDRMREPSSFRPESPNGMTDEPTLLGWSRRSGEFVICTPGGGAVCDRCDFHRPGQAPTHIETGEDCGDDRVTPLEFERRLADAQVRIEDGNWAYGADVVVVVRVGEGPADVDGYARGIVEIGARLRDEAAPVAWLESIEQCNEDGWCAPEVHVDAIAPAPDGRTIAVLVHTFAGEYSDTYPLILLDADELASAARAAQMQ